MDDEQFEAELRRNDLRPDPVDAGRSGWTPGRVLAVVGVAAMAAFWVWAFSPWAPRGNPDELDDPAFARAAEQRCAAVLDELARLPGAPEAVDALDRARQIDESTVILAELVDDLMAIAPDPAGRDGDLVRRWLADWVVYIGDRYAYADDFRNGIDAPFAVTAVRGEQVTEPIDAFAVVNAMPSCATPADV